MKPLINNPVKYFITGFIVLLFMSLSLFWIRFACEIFHYSFCHNSVHIHPSGLAPTEFENDPNVTRHSIVSAYIRPSEPVFLGAFDYFFSMFPGERHSSVYYLDRDNRWIYFDKKLGLLVCRYSLIKKIPNNNRLAVEYIERYVGPKGISERPNKPLGRFIEPIIDSSEIYSHQQKFDERILYDKKLRQFFKIDFDKQAVIKGPKIKKHDCQPIQMGWPIKNTFGSPTMDWQPPKVQKTQDNENSENTQAELESIIPYEQGFDAGPYLLVLDITGRIDLLNKDTLEFDGIAGRLPATETYFGTTQSGTPKSLLDYIVQPIVLNKHYLEDGKLHKMTFGASFDPEQQLRYNTLKKPIDPEPVVSKVDRKYLGMAVCSVSRSGTALALTVFDAEGKQLKTQYTKGEKYIIRRHERYIPSSKAVFWEIPWAPVATIVKYSAENLHPPILSILSYFTTESFEAASGHRALFILPNSFIAMKGRDTRANFTERLFTALLLISPSIVLSLILSWRISKDAKVVGLSKSTQLFWLICTILFGLVAYITYRLTRPKITLVTCQNCGRPRRTDMDLCHQCKSKWNVPELIPPKWRVVD
jgi:hypothetical protein